MERKCISNRVILFWVTLIFSRRGASEFLLMRSRKNISDRNFVPLSDHVFYSDEWERRPGSKQKPFLRTFRGRMKGFLRTGNSGPFSGT